MRLLHLRAVLAITLATAIGVVTAALSLAQTNYEFKLGFAALANQIPGVVSMPLENEHYGANGDSLQQTTTGLMVWRKADNWTAFTNGSRTWVNGPFGVMERPNEARFEWEGTEIIGTPTSDQKGMAVSYQVNVAHDGYMPDPSLVPPLAQKWHIDLSQTLSSYPLIARGKVFVTHGVAGTSGTALVALNGVDGTITWGPMDVADGFVFPGIAYDDGKVFAANFAGELRAYDADTGKQLWYRKLPAFQGGFFSAPVAEGGHVFLLGVDSSDTYLYKVNGANGEVVWKQPAAGGNAPPTLWDDRVTVASVCENVYAFDRETGAMEWIHTGTCSGGGGFTAVYYQGRLYARDNPLLPSVVLDARTGAKLEEGGDTQPPAFAHGRGFFPSRGTLTARSVPGGQKLWSQEGDGTPISAPVVVAETVYVGTAKGSILGYDAASGREVWTAALPGQAVLPNQGTNSGTTHLNAGEGLLVVSRGRTVTAFGPR